jgi:predicted small secreted protein
MNWKYFLLGISTGLAGAYVLKEATARKETVSPEVVLEQVKTAFKKEGPISGSWINMNAEPYTQSPITYNVYKGGISRNVEGQSELYEFIADALTGTVIKTKYIS